MNYSAIKKFDIADGPGVRVTLFVSGCRHHCEGCFQPDTWSFSAGGPFSEAVEEELLTALSGDRIAGLTLLGGEPFEPENQLGLIAFLRKYKERFPDKTIWAFTGYELSFAKEGGFYYQGNTQGKSPSELPDETMTLGSKGPVNAIPYTQVSDEMLGMLDVLVDGEFILAQRNLMLKFRGSENQRLIDVKKSKEAGRIVLLDA